MQRRGIVDSVTEVANHVAAVFQRVDNPVLLHRRNAREHGAFLGQMLECGVAHLFEFFAENDRRILQSNLFANMPGHKFVISRQNFHLHAIALQCLNGRRAIGVRRSANAR